MGEAIIAWVAEHSWSVYVMGAVTISSGIMMMMPSSVKGKNWYNVIMKGVNYMALNFNKAKSKDDNVEIKVVENK